MVANPGGFAKPDPGLPAPDTKWHALPVPFRNGGLADPTARGFSVLLTLVDVRSRGKISLRSADPRHKPVIDPGYLTDPADLEALVRAVRIVRQIAAARPLRKMWAAEEAPGAALESDAEIREFVRRDVTTIYHPAGTRPMSRERPLA